MAWVVVGLTLPRNESGVSTSLLPHLQALATAASIHRASLAGLTSLLRLPPGWTVREVLDDAILVADRDDVVLHVLKPDDAAGTALHRVSGWCSWTVTGGDIVVLVREHNARSVSVVLGSLQGSELSRERPLNVDW